MSAEGKGKLVIGVVGGIGSGKSSVARYIADEFDGVRFDADMVARRMLEDPQVKQQVVAWWGDDVLDPSGAVDRKAVARIVFEDPAQRKKLEGLIHPRVIEQREQFVEQAMANSAVKVIVLDVPLLVEVGLHEQCDRVIFVQCDRATRLRRLAVSRGWTEADLAAREKNQLPLDRKLDLAHDVVDNSGGEAVCRRQVRDAVLRIL